MERNDLIYKYFKRRKALEKLKELSAPDFIVKESEKALKKIVKKLGNVKRLEIGYAYWKIGEELYAKREGKFDKICEGCKFYFEDLPDKIFEIKDLGKMPWCKRFTLKTMEDCKKRATLNKNI